MGRKSDTSRHAWVPHPLHSENAVCANTTNPAHTPTTGTKDDVFVMDGRQFTVHHADVGMLLLPRVLPVTSIQLTICDGQHKGVRMKPERKSNTIFAHTRQYPHGTYQPTPSRHTRPPTAPQRSQVYTHVIQAPCLGGKITSGCLLGTICRRDDVKIILCSIGRDEKG